MSMAFEDAYCAQKPLPKKEVMKLKPGTWIEVRWLDSPNTLHLLIVKPFYQPGDVTLVVLDVCAGGVLKAFGRKVDHDQVVAVHGSVVPPTFPVSR